jgi:transcriptional regulator with XRE-family HTH domain
VKNNGQVKGHGEFLKQHRLASGQMTQRVLAEKAGLATATISKIESNYQCPEPRTIQLLSEHLYSTNFDELMEAFGYPSSAKENGVKVDYQLFRKIELYIGYRNHIERLENDISNFRKLTAQQIQRSLKESFKQNIRDTSSNLGIYKQKILSLEKELIEAGVQLTKPVHLSGNNTFLKI